MEDVKVTWCVTCQRGHSGIKPAVTINSDCPICLENVRTGRIGEDKVGKVWDMDEYKEYVGKKNEIKRLELEEKKRKSIGVKGVDIHRKEIEAEFKAKFDAQQQEIEHMKAMVNKLSKADSPKSEESKSEFIEKLNKK